METWTVKRMLDWMEGYLADHGDEQPKASAQWLVSDALDLSKLQLYLDLERPLGPSELDLLRDYVKRRAQGEPLQYITGKTFFRHIEVAVEPGVLIPRPETEVLVSEVLSHLPRSRQELEWVSGAQGQVDGKAVSIDSESFAEDAKGAPDTTEGAGEVFHQTKDVQGISDQVQDSAQPVEPAGRPEMLALPQYARIAEIGCGSGCIACSLAYENPDVEVFCTDISPVAVELTLRNAESVNVKDRVHAIEGDLASGLDGIFDVVVSNPPYIPTELIESIPDEVASFEPRIALDGGTDGLDVFRRIADWAMTSLSEGGLLACELHEDSLSEASRIVEAAGFRNIRVVKDLAGRDRILTAVR